MTPENYQAAMNTPIERNGFTYGESVPCTLNCHPAFNKAACKTCYPWLEKASNTNSDGSDQGIEMHPDSWATIQRGALYLLAAIGLTALCAAAVFATARYFN